MPSNALSRRRAHMARPIVCKPPPPPPPPPGPPWPPGFITVSFEYTYPWMMGPETESWAQEAEREGVDWQWSAFDLPIDGANIIWTVFTIGPHATLSISGSSVNFGNYEAIKNEIPITLGSPHLYVITGWDVLTDGLISAKASLYF